MTDFDLLYVFERYGADAVLVAFFVVLGVWILKKTLLKNHLHSFLVWALPFLLGILCFGILQCILHPSLSYLLGNLSYIVQRGFAVGCLSTLESALLAPFFGKKALSQRASVVRELIGGLVEEKSDELAEEIAACISSEYSEEDVKNVLKLLVEYAGEGCSEVELNALAELIVQTLKTTAA